MKLKRILAIILTLIFTMQYAVAEEIQEPKYKIQKGEKNYGMFLLLQQMGYFEDLDALELEKTVRRDKFAEWLSLTANLTDTKPLYTREFKDVPETHKSYNAVQNVVSAGYMNGVAEGNFGPSMAISIQDAAVTLVRLAGYDNVAIFKGGYPDGYLATAYSLRIMDGVTMEASTYNVLRMIYNALQAVYMNPEGISGDKIIYSREETVAQKLHNIYEIRGRMTANGYTDLMADVVIANKASCKIDQVEYNMPDDFHGLIGRNIRGWYRVDTETDEKSIVAIYENNDDNNIFELDMKDILNVGNDCRIQYTYDNGRTKYVELIRGFDFIYNKRAVFNTTMQDLRNLAGADGSIVLIDYNGDKVYDTLDVREAKTMQVKAIDHFDFKIYCNEGIIKCKDFDESFFEVSIKDDEGVTNKASIDSLSVGQVLTVYASRDDVYVEILAATETYNGVVNGVNEDYIVIGEKEYALAREAVRNEIKIGTTVEVLLDVYGRVAYVDYVSGSNRYEYGYLFKAWYNDFDGYGQAKIVTKDGPITFKIKDMFLIDGETVYASARLSNTGATPLDRQMIKYRVNSKGEITGIDTPGLKTDDYHNTLKSEGKKTMTMYSLPQIIDTKYKITADTFFVVVPGIAAEKEDIELYKNTYSFNTEAVDYTLEVFDVNPDNMSVGAYICYPSESLTGPQNLDAQAGVAVFDRFKTRWEDGETKTFASIYVGGNKAEYECEPTLTDRNFAFGDVVRYKVNVNGNISSLVKELDIEPSSWQQSRQLYTADGYYNFNFGRILSKEDGYVVLLTSVNNPEYVMGDSEDTYKNIRIINTQKISTCVLVDLTEKKVESISMKSLAEYIPGESTPSYAYARSYKYNDVMGLFVYKF